MPCCIGILLHGHALLHRHAFLNHDRRAGRLHVLSRLHHRIVRIAEPGRYAAWLAIGSALPSGRGTALRCAASARFADARFIEDRFRFLAGEHELRSEQGAARVVPDLHGVADVRFEIDARHRFDEALDVARLVGERVLRAGARFIGIANQPRERQAGRRVGPLDGPGFGGRRSRRSTVRPAHLGRSVDAGATGRDHEHRADERALPLPHQCVSDIESPLET